MSLQPVTGWFCYKDENQYNELKAIFQDANTLPSTFASWKQQAEQGIQIEESKGVLVIKAYPESIDDFIRFCRLNSKSLSSEGRTYFANIKAIEYLRRR